ncbi:MAG: DUF3078 domain-containing protein [Crocinitomix sp.]|nr:DUF3078 domain-containing protein [Crocinitomix sp.]
MKKVLMLAIGLATTMAFGQITEGEDDLVTVCKDTVDGWKKGGYFSLNGSQVSLTNWVAGGQNSVSINSLFGLYANLKKGPMTWENSLHFGYGLMNQGENLFSGDEKWIKTDDRLDITSKFGQKASKVCYYAALTNFRTQTTAGYGADDNFTEISGFLAPAYWLTAIGMDYKPSMKEGSEFSLFVAPITSKLTFVNDTLLANAGAFGVDEAFIDDITGLYNPGKKFRSEFGGYMRIKYKTKLAENITFTTKLDLFSNYIDNPSRIDVNWENLLEIKLWKFLSATISTHLVYDDDVNISFKDYSGNETAFGPRVQFKEVFGLGLAWKFDQ